MNKKLIETRFAKKLTSYNDNAVVQKAVISNLIKLVPFINYGNVLEIGCGTGLLTKILGYLSAEKLYINDLCEDVKKYINIRSIPNEFLIGDAELIDFPKNIDMIISANTLQWFEDIEGFFAKSANSLNKGGKLIFSTFVKDNYEEITQIFNTSLNYKTEKELCSLAGQYFNIKVAKSEKMTLHFDTLNDLLNHIKATGVNALPSSKLTKTKLINAQIEYEKLRTDKGLPLTYVPAYFSLEKN